MRKSEGGVTLEEQAERLAARPYVTQIDYHPREKSYYASNPTLPGCGTQGATIEEAESKLLQIREKYIFELLRQV